MDSQSEPLVWVTVGKTQHAAFLLESDGSRNKIRWASSQKIDWVEDEQIQFYLKSRRQNKRDSHSRNDDDSYTDSYTLSSPTTKRIPVAGSCDDGESPPKKPCVDNNSAGAIIATNTTTTTTTTSYARKSGPKSRDDPRLSSSHDELIRGLHQTSTSQKKSLEFVEVIDLVQQESPGVPSVEDKDDEDTKLPSGRPNGFLEIPHDLHYNDILPYPRITYRSSAYVQNLAEICYFLYNDMRWRLPHDGKALFRWEWGDDLSAMIAFSRLYMAPTELGEDGNTSTCSCILCRDQQADPTEKYFDKDSRFHQKDSEPNDEDIACSDDDARMMHLLARLFYRKGPFFRMDDLFNRYYATKRIIENEENEVPTGDPATEIKKPRKDFFAARNISSIFQQTSTTGAAAEKYVDEQILNRNVENAVNLLKDIELLVEKGYLRSFSSEEECGKTVGVDILTSEERNELLQKLGGVKPKRDNRRRSENTNEIWQQMSKQRTLFSVNGSRSLLPVRRHLNNLILERLSFAIVRKSAASQGIALPQKIIRRYMNFVQSSLRSAGVNLGSLAPAVVRIREPVNRTLRRAARLFLCATSGPGDMRSDGSNGWKSVVKPSSINFVRGLTVSPPDENAWSTVQFPGLTHRFGLSASPYFRSFKAHLNPEKLNDVAIFRSLDDFLLWEKVVEVRCNIDFILNLNESLRYDKRRRDRGLQGIVQGFNDDNDVSKIDFLGVVTKQTDSDLISGFALTDQQIASLQRDREGLAGRSFSTCDHLLIHFSLLILNILVGSKLSDGVHDTCRPWLRHLSWKACLAYCLWDLIPILERHDFYAFAIEALSVLLLGSRSAIFDRDDEEHQTDIWGIADKHRGLLSRRARGKAIDRLIIDLQHLNRKCDKRSFTVTDDHIRLLVKEASSSAAISFSSVRGLAKRLKRPLWETLHDERCPESEILGLRMGSNIDTLGSEQKKKYADWTPTVDRALANSIGGGDVGSRCAFLGHEEEEDKSPSSMNVEELSLEYYRTGRLPHSPKGEKGGWYGWHDEGGHFRALFRIFCDIPLFGSDWGCVDSRQKEHASSSLISPHQVIPFDLHVGFQALEADGSFFTRRRETIDKLLAKLERMNSDELVAYVHESIKRRFQFLKGTKLGEQTMAFDLVRSKTLSFIAAACGGRMLSSIFKAMLFDYRHYSGGLPDLLLVRALYMDDNSVVNLGEWIGESFASADSQASAILADEEFLGCSKAGDSATGGHRFGGRGRSSPLQHKMMLGPFAEIEPLELEHGGRKIHVESMVVEVKSSNDRLDSRQEDWLNILDKHGNARVCKFESKKSKK